MLNADIALIITVSIEIMLRSCQVQLNDLSGNILIKGHIAPALNCLQTM